MTGGFTRFLCPLSGCDWFHDSPDVPPGMWQWKGSIETSVAALSMKRVQGEERIITAHVETHSLTDWLRDLQKERQRADAAEAKLTAWQAAIAYLQAGAP